MEVYANTGEQLGRVSIPADIRILDMRDDAALGLRTDDMGRESLVILTIVPARR